VVAMASQTLVENEISMSKWDRKHSPTYSIEFVHEVNTAHKKQHQRKRSSPELIANKSLNIGQNNLVKGLQYGEILFRCTSTE